jgi:uncharacterized protein (DUF433 family)
MSTTVHIITDPEILGGKPVIAGTRISVDLILSRLREGRSSADIATEYPHITRDQVAAAIEEDRIRVRTLA